jgi:hypothetical protein
MDGSTHVSLAPRLSQGDFARAPTGVIENDDRCDWHLASPLLGIESCRVIVAATTTVLVRCPEALRGVRDHQP